MLKYNFLALERSVFVNSAVFTGTDEDAILMLITARSNNQRQEIKAAYKKAFGKVGYV